MTELPTLYSEVALKNDPASDLDEIHIRLPIGDQILGDSLETDPKLKFENLLTQIGGAVPFDKLVDQISYRLLNDSKTIVLSPLLINNGLQLKFHKLILQLPDTVLTNCLSVLKLDDNSFIIDILTEHGLFITLSFQLDDFTNHKISLENFPDWGRYDMPYSIETRNPHSISILSEKLTIVPFIDGGLLLLKRNSKFDQVETITFTDSSYFDSITKLFRRSPGDEFIDNKISVRTTISSALLNDNYLMTLSINKKFRIWSLLTNTVVFEQDLINSELNFNLHPSNLIKVIDSSANGDFKFATLIPLKHEEIIVWNLSLSNDQFLLQEICKLTPPKIDDINWSTQLFEVITKAPLQISVYLLLRSNNFQKLLIGDTNIGTGMTSWTNSDNVVIDEKPELNSSLQFAESVNEYYLRKIFNEYNDLILQTVCAIFETHFSTFSDEKTTLEKRILSLIEYDLDEEDSEYLNLLKNQWTRFDGSCKELLKTCFEPIQLLHSKSLDMLYVMKSYGISVFQKSTTIKLISQDSHSHLNEVLSVLHKTVSSKSVSQLLLLLAKFKLVFTEDVIDELKYSLVDLDADDIEGSMTSLFEEKLSEHLTEDIIEQLLTSLGAIPNVLTAMEFFSVNDNTGFDYNFISSKLSYFGSSLLMESIKNDISVYENCTIGLALIMLVIDNNSQVTQFFTGLVSKLKSLKVLSIIMDLGFDDLFSTIISKHFHVKGFKLIDPDTINEISKAIFQYAFSSDSMLISAVVELIHADKVDQIIKHGIYNFLQSGNPVHIMLKGLIYLKLSEDDKAYKILTTNAEKITTYNLSVRESSDLELLSTSSLVFGSTLMKYYITLTDLFMENEHIKNAYSLAKLALKFYDPMDDEDSKDGDTINWNLFQLSLKLSDYDRTFESIQSLSHTLKLKSIKIFALHLLETKSISTLLNYNFQENISVVDSIILKLAQQQDFIINSLNYYKILYSWRLSFGDKRGALEAIYQFIDKFEKFVKSQKKQGFMENSIQIQPLYLITLNVLRTIQETDDQWIIKHVKNGENVVMTFDDLEKEYRQKF